MWGSQWFSSANVLERYKKLKLLSPAPQKPGNMWLLDYESNDRRSRTLILNQTTEGREHETVALVIMDAHSSLVRVIPCKNRGNVLQHILDTIALWGHTTKRIKADNAQEFVNEKKFKAWRQANGIALVEVQAYKHRMQAQIENFIRHLKGMIRCINILKGIPDRFWPDLAKKYG